MAVALEMVPLARMELSSIGWNAASKASSWLRYMRHCWVRDAGVSADAGA